MIIRIRNASISGTQVRNEHLNNGLLLPDWFTKPEVAEILAESYPPLYNQDVCIWFTWLSSSGKSTTAEVLIQLLLENRRQVIVLDGDVVRTHLTKELGFSKEDRDINIIRIGYVGFEIVWHGSPIVCAAVSLYRATRNEVRNLITRDRFVEVFVDTPLDICEKRDYKGIYVKEKRGEIKGFMGIDDPYEPPEFLEIRFDKVSQTPRENAIRILDYLFQQGFFLNKENAKDLEASHQN